MGNKGNTKIVYKRKKKNRLKNSARIMREAKKSQETSNMKTCPESLPGGLKDQQNYDDEGDAWLSCQTDINKLVQPIDIIDEEFKPDDKCTDTIIDNHITDNTHAPLPIIHGRTSPLEPIDIIDEEFKPDGKCIDAIIDKRITDNTLPPLPIIHGRTSPIESLDEWVINKSLCRCCHAEGSFTSLEETAQGENVTYDNMLRTGLNLQLFPVSSAMGAVCAVCALCAVRLRDAFAFSQQVRACEALFRDLYQKNNIKVPNVEIELKEEPQDANDDFNFEMDATSDAPDQLVVEQEVNPKKVEAKRQNDKNTSKKIRKVTAPKGKKPKALQSTLLNKRTKRPPPIYTRVGVSYKCTRCERVAGSCNTIRNHFNLTHLKEGAHKCTLCLNRFMDENRLINHKLIEHNIDERFKCNACDKVYYQKRHLKSHMDTFHMMGEKSKCSMCDYETYDRRKLIGHLDKHKTTKDFHCKYCKKSFLRKNTLNFHERIHTGDKRKACAECGQKFVQKASLNYHMTKYHPEVRF